MQEWVRAAAVDERGRAVVVAAFADGEGADAGEDVP